MVFNLIDKQVKSSLSNLKGQNGAGLSLHWEFMTDWGFLVFKLK